MDYKIRAVQLDVNGLCNAGCWYCPVSYAGNPKQAIRDMPIEEVENILIQINDGKGDFVDPDLSLIYSANYNELLLYKNLEEFLILLRKYGFKTNILTNGVALTKAKVDILIKYQDVINGILLNIPSADAEKWSGYVNMNIKLFDKVMSNLNYLVELLDQKLFRPYVHLMINGINSKSLTKNGGWLDLLDNAPSINLDEETGDLSQELIAFKNKFPTLDISTSHHLYDRAEHLEKYGILTQKFAINKYLKKEGKKVVGCSGGLGVRSRTNEWIHINANGDIFICCADYDFDTIFGSLKNKTLKEIWGSKERQEMISKSYSDMCTKCSAAIWA